MNWGLLQNSFLVAGLTALLASAAGFCAAIWLTGLERRGRAGFLVLAAVTFALPPFLVADCWMQVLSWAGLPIERFVTRIAADSGWAWSLGLVGVTALVLSLMFWPVALFFTLGAWRQIEASHLESEPALTGWALVRLLLWPVGRAAVFQAAALLFVLALNNFAVPALLQVKVFPAEIWVRFTTTFDYAGAFAMSSPMLLAPLLLLLILRRSTVVWPRLEGAVPAELFRRQFGRFGFLVTGLATMGLFLISLGLPLAELCGSSRTWRELGPAVMAGQEPILNSLTLPTAVATLILALSYLTWRWPIGMASWLPLLVPGVMLGIAFIYVLNRPGLFGLYQSLGVVLLAWTIRYFAVGWQGVSHARRSIDRDLIDAARLEGARGWTLWRLAIWPQIAPQAAAAWFVTYLLCLWDVETLVLIVPPGGETVSLRVFNLLHYGHNAQVSALCLVLLTLAVLPLLVCLAWGAIARGLRPATRSGQHLVPTSLALGLLLFNGCSPAASNEAPMKSRIFRSVQVIGMRGVGPGQFNKPRSLAVDAQDNLYVVDMTGRVQKFAPDGRYLAYWQIEQTDLGKPKGMCLDAQGNLIVIEPHYARINHFTPDGRLVAQWGGRGTNLGRLVFPRAAAVNSRGEIYVSEYTTVDRVQKFGPQGTNWLGAFGRSGSKPGEFSRAEGLGIDAQDRLYVADSCNHRIQVLDADGKVLRVYGKAGSGRGELSYPYDVRVDSEGRQYVCEFGNSRIQIFGPDDQPLEILGERGGAPGQFSNPWSIALDSKGNLYVADAMNHRVQKFARKEPVAGGPRAEVRSQKSGVRSQKPAVSRRESEGRGGITEARDWQSADSNPSSRFSTGHWSLITRPSA